MVSANGDPFFIRFGGSTPARSLEAGDTLLGAEGTLAVVANEHEAHPHGVTVYNLEVEQAHTYFVLAADANDAAPVWVHNATGYDTKAGARLSTANRGSRTFELYEGTQKSGWKHIFDRHVDLNGYPLKSKFDGSLGQQDIVELLGQTVKRGKESTFHGQTIFEWRTNYQSTGYRTYRATANADGTIQSFHPLG